MLAKQYVLFFNIVWVSWPRNLKVLSIKSFNISEGGYSILFFLYEDVFFYIDHSPVRKDIGRENQKYTENSEENVSIATG